MAIGSGEDRLLAGRYALGAPIGRGGMGTVWRARDEVLDRDVAVKEVLPNPGLSDEDREVLHERTKREAKASARLNHPGIVTVHDVFEEDGRPWIVMELVPADSLQGVLDTEGPLPARQVAEIGLQTLSALRAAHAAGILHRDVKPANVLLLRGEHIGPNGIRTILTDFGLAQMAGDVTLTQTGLVMGSPAYISPERARGERAGPEADLWALGATLYAGLEGRPPHDRSDAMAALAAVLTEDPKPPESGGALTPVVLRLLARDPAERPTAGEAVALLAPIARGVAAPPADPAVRRETVVLEAQKPPTVPMAGPPPPQPPPRHAQEPVRQGPRRWIGAAGAAAAVIAAVAITAYAVSHSGDTPAVAGPPAVTPEQRGPAQDPQPSKLPGTRAKTIPAGWHSVAAGGYGLALPPGWFRKDRGTSAVWKDPASAAYVQIDEIPWTGDPVTHWRQWQSEVIAKKTLRNFALTVIRKADAGPGTQAADAEFTWTSAIGPTVGLDRGVAVTADGRHYAVLVAIPARGWPGRRQQAEQILSSFHIS